MTDRWQRVSSSSGHSSPWTSVTSGVPQGSVLGPILFAIVLNRFPQLSKNSKMIAYADDLLILHDLCPTGHDDNLQADVSIVLSWLSSLKFTVNIDKFKYISFSRHPCLFPPLYINDGPITEVDEIKFLGVIFQSNLKLDCHLNSVIKKASSSLHTSLNSFGLTTLLPISFGKPTSLWCSLMSVTVGLLFVILRLHCFANSVPLKKEFVDGLVFVSQTVLFVLVSMASACALFAR